MSEAEEAALIWCPFPDEPAAAAAVDVLLTERLIACGNMLPGMRSVFVWKGCRNDESECGALLKTSAAKLGEAMERLAQLHPYDTPAITGWTVRAGAGTVAWLKAETEQNGWEPG